MRDNDSFLYLAIPYNSLNKVNEKTNYFFDDGFYV